MVWGKSNAVLAVPVVHRRPAVCVVELRKRDSQSTARAFAERRLK
jgi:hypothetical protein